MTTETANPVALITGAARRIGAEIARVMHEAGYDLVLHYRRSFDDIQALAGELLSRRAKSIVTLQADLRDFNAVEQLARETLSAWDRLDALINNASSFYPTPVGEITAEAWLDLMGTNVQAPLFLSQALAPALRESRGCIINIADVHGERPLSRFPLYCIAKAGNIMLTKSLAKELAPLVRVNGIAPGAIMWPENDAEVNDETKAKILARVALRRIGSPTDIARSVRFLVTDAPYITGQVLAVDGGRNLVS